MAIRKIDDSILADIADAIRGKTGDTATMKPNEMAALIESIVTKAILQSKSVSPSTSAQTVTPDSGYDGLSQVTVNAMPTATQATPSISVSAAGLITASATQTAGYVAAGTKSATQQMTVQGAQTITPGTSNKTIASGRYLTGTQTIKGDSNLVAANIKSGVSIFGVLGTLASGGGGDINIAPLTEIAVQSMTYATDSSVDINITHGMAQRPKFAVMFPVTTIANENYNLSILVLGNKDTKNDWLVGALLDGTANGYYITSFGTNKLTTTKVYFSGFAVPAGSTYYLVYGY